MLTEGRMSVIIGREKFPLDCSEQDRLHLAIKKRPELGKLNQKRRIAGKMETCICVYLSSFPPEVRKKFEKGKE